MDVKDKSIIDKILKIAGVDACAVSSLDGEVLKYETNGDEILPEQINKVSLEISKLFASYSISSIDISSLYLNFDDRNIIVNGFGSGFIFILSKRNSNVNLLKMETSYLESEFIKIVSQSLINTQAVDSAVQSYSKNEGNEDEDVFNALFGGKSGGEIKTHKLVTKKNLDSIKDIFSSSLGPISAILFDEKVKELNEDVNNFNAENIENLINRLSEEIEGKKDRLNFIAAAKNIINF
ncbi:MAG: hypothetical protein M0Z86_00920 [Deltaproteobacteria bacterium]|nr:hypothetical protein [Deltaproteobacteria bacterium]